MCIFFFVFGHPQFPVLLCSNRDEYYVRPTRRGSVQNGVYMPIDESAGGTWLTFDQEGGRYCCILNFHEWRVGEKSNASKGVQVKSRGLLPKLFIESKLTPKEFVNSIDFQMYNGFNIIVGDVNSCFYASNYSSAGSSVVKELSPNTLYGISNGFLNEWPKVERGKEIMHMLLKDIVLEKEDGQMRVAQLVQDLMNQLLLCTESLPDPSIASCLSRSDSENQALRSVFAMAYKKDPQSAEEWELEQDLRQLSRIFVSPTALPSVFGGSAASLFGTRTATVLAVSRVSWTTDGTTYNTLILERDASLTDDSQLSWSDRWHSLHTALSGDGLA